MPSQNKIEKTLSAEELARFCERLRKERNVTLQKIADFYEEETGEYVSLMGATTFRDTTFAKHLQRISKASELAHQVAALRQAGAGHTIADAAAAIISDEVLEKLVNRDENEELDLDVLSKIVKRLRDSDSRVRALEHTIKFREQAAAKAVLSDPELRTAIAQISRNQSMGEEEKIEAVRKRLFGERPSDFSPVTTTGAAYIS